MFKIIPKKILIAIAQYVLDLLYKELSKLGAEKQIDITSQVNSAMGGMKRISPESLPKITLATSELLKNVKV